jgi:hypothetical protein
MGEAKRRGGAQSLGPDELVQLAVGAALSGATLRLGNFPSGGLHFYGPEPDIIARTAVAAAVAVWGKPMLGWTMPLDEFERELRARDGECVVLADFAASVEQIDAALTACSAVRVAVVSWGVGSVAAKVGVDRALDVVVDVPMPRMKGAKSITHLQPRGACT